MNVKQEAVSDVLKDCAESLLTVIRHLHANPDEPVGFEVLMTLGSVQAATDTVHKLLAADTGKDELESEYEPEMQIKRPPDTKPAFLAEIEDDNPETEDKDLKKQREEERGWYA